MVTITYQISLRNTSMRCEPILLGEQRSYHHSLPHILSPRLVLGSTCRFVKSGFLLVKSFESHCNDYRESERSDRKGHLNANVFFHSLIDGYLDCPQCFALEKML